MSEFRIIQMINLQCSRITHEISQDVEQKHIREGFRVQMEFHSSL